MTTGNREEIDLLVDGQEWGYTTAEKKENLVEGRPLKISGSTTEKRGSFAEGDADRGG